MRDVLVLNRVFVPVHICGWQKAMCLLYRGHAHAVDEGYREYNFDEWKELSQMMKDNPSGFITTMTFKIAVPEVISLSFYDRLPDNSVKFTRKNIYHHYREKCCYCGKQFDTPDLNLDHVTPRSRGGNTTWDNIVLSCIPCNVRKANRTPDEAHMKMHYQPSKPSWRRALAVQVRTPGRMRVSWKHFLDVAYWETELKS